MRGRKELAEALQAATVAIDATSNPETVFATVGCHLEDAIRFARSNYLLLLCVPDPDAENPVVWSGPLLAVGERQAERAWLNGCLVGLFMAGPTAEKMEPSALPSAEKKLNAQAVEEEQRTYELTSLEYALSSVGLDPEAFMEGAVPVAVNFARPLEEFALGPLDMAQCAHTLAGLWLIGIMVATQARREHDQP